MAIASSIRQREMLGSRGPQDLNLGWGGLADVGSGRD
jgi:hypothetical protein